MAEKSPTKGRYKFRPKKRLGQHFLRDQGFVLEIINRARFEESDQVLEVGAGMGALTLPLSGSVHQVMAVEKDKQLAVMLRKKLSRAGIENVILINDDILRLDLSGIPRLPKRKMKVIANLPYNISSPFLEKLVQNRNLVSRAVLMFQLELARRLVARPGNKDFGAMSVLIQYHARLTPLIEVPKEAFYPMPRVGSMVLELDFEKPYPLRAEDEIKFRMVVKGAFAYRRKSLFNSLKRALFSYTANEILTALEACDIDPGKRAETLSIGQFLCLASALKSLP